MKKFIISNFGTILMVISFGISFYMMFTMMKDSEETKLELKKQQSLKDSLEIEYYKKMLESYPFDHSKIPQ